MKKIFSSPSKATLFLIVSVSVLAILINACRKIDHQRSKPDSLLEEKFFNFRKSSEPHIQAINAFMKRLNNNENFVVPTVKQIGYPYWDKALIVKSASSQRSEADSTTITYIPFVRESENFVNALVVVQTEPGTDTIFKYLCDWQYSRFSNSLTSPIDSAEEFALFFMLIDNLVFGHTNFIITDTALFKYNDSLVSSVDIRISEQNDLTQITNASVLSMPAGPICIQAELNLSGCISCGNIGYQQCWNEYYGVGVGTNGSEPPIGDNGGPGGGWAPGTSTNPSEPIDSLLKKASVLANKYRDSLSSICETDSAEIFFNIVLNNNQYDTFGVKKGISSEEVVPNYYIGNRIRKGEWHYHPKYPDGTSGSWPSGGDVTTLLDKSVGHVMIIDTYDARYALVVENASQMQIWKNIAGNGPKVFPTRVADSVMADPRAYNTGSVYVNMTKEKIIACLGTAASSGIGLYQATSSTGTSFIKVN